MKHIDINDNDPNFIPTTVLNRLDKMSDDLTGSLLKNLANRFKDEIADGIKEGLTSKEIGKRLQAKYGDFKNKTTQSIVARTLLHAAYNQGNMFDALQDDMIVAFRFSNPADARSTQICKHLAGKVIKKEDIKDFIPPLHWGCRSTLIPLFYNDDIDPATVVDKQMRQTDWFKKNVAGKLDKEFTDFTSMDLTKAVEEAKETESDEINVPEEIKRMTNETLDRLSDILDRQTLPFNTSGVADFVARESMLEAVKQTLPETPSVRITKDYIRTDSNLRPLYDAYKDGDLYDTLLKTNAYDISKAIETAGKRIFENEAVKAFKADSVDDENITAFLENNHGAARISPQLQERFKNVLKQFGRDPDFFNITLNDLRRRITAGLSNYSDFHMLDESAQIAFAEYLTEFFKSIDRGAKVTFKDKNALNETIINTFIRHADYDTFIETAPMALFNGAAFAGIKRHLNEAISAVTSNEFEANEIRNRIALSGVERIDTRSAVAAVESVKRKLKLSENKKGVGAANDKFENNLNRENIKIAKPVGKPIISDEDFENWIELIAKEKMKRGRTEVIGQINEKILDKLSEKGIELSTNELVINDVQIIHLLRDAKQNRNQAIDLDTLKKIKEIIDNPEMVLWDQDDPAIVYISSGKDKNDKIKFVLKINQFIKTNEGKKFTNYIVTAGIIKENNTREKHYENIKE